MVNQPYDRCQEPDHRGPKKTFMVRPHKHESGRRMIGALTRIPSDEVRRRISAAMAARYGLTQSHMGIFQHVDHPPEGTRQTELAERMQITKQALGELVDDMERRGMVERRPVPGDRRAKLVCLTDLGWEAHEYASEFGVGIEADWSRRMGEAKFAELIALLQELEQRIFDD